jgi:DNA-binding response OmpR family regulator
MGPNNEWNGKPFHYPEVEARVRAVLWRRAGAAPGPRSASARSSSTQPAGRFGLPGGP